MSGRRASVPTGHYTAGLFAMGLAGIGCGSTAANLPLATAAASSSSSPTAPTEFAPDPVTSSPVNAHQVLSERALREKGQGARVAPLGQVYAFDVGGLSRFRLPAPLDAKDAPAKLNKPEQPADLAWEDIPSPFDPAQRRRVSVRGVSMGNIQIGPHGGEVNPRAGGGAYVVCDDPAARIEAASWTTWTRTSAVGTLQVTRAWIDRTTCELEIVDRTQVQLRPLIDGLLYGAQSCPAGEEDCAQPDLVIVGPSFTVVSSSASGAPNVGVSPGSLSMVRVPIRRGGAVSVIMRITKTALERFNEVNQRPSVEKPKNVFVEIDVSQGVAEKRATGLGYVIEDGAATLDARVDALMVRDH